MGTGKRLIVCMDGTWNNAESESADTNVARIARAIHAHPGADGMAQLVLYLRGVGTAGLVGEKIIEGTVGLGVDDLIRSAYMFLAQNYEPGDQIFIFGFSRGSFSARSLVGLIAACGLLFRSSLGELGNAWNYYRRPKPHSPAAFVAEAEVETHCDVRIRFLGVWDTVGALGVPGSLFARLDADQYAFHDTGPCPIIDFGYHAVAIDEHREDFVPTLWTGDAPTGTSILQVWFAGAHADVGGGYADRTLADVPLLWMADRAAGHGLNLDRSCLPDAGNPLGTMHDSSSGVFLVNRVSPTYREMCGRPAEVSFYERVYRPTGPDHQPLVVLNEAVHSSVSLRWGKQVRSESTSFPKSGRTIAYQSINAAAVLDAGIGKRLPGIVGES